MGLQWHQVDHMQIICTSLQTDNHASFSPLSFTGRMPFLLRNHTAKFFHWPDAIPVASEGIGRWTSNFFHPLTGSWGKDITAFVASQWCQFPDRKCWGKWIERLKKTRHHVRWCWRKQTCESDNGALEEKFLSRVTTLPGKSWNLVRPFSRPGRSCKTAKVMENDDDVLEFFCKNALEFLFL